MVVFFMAYFMESILILFSCFLLLFIAFYCVFKSDDYLKDSVLCRGFLYFLLAFGVFGVLSIFILLISFKYGPVLLNVCVGYNVTDLLLLV
jgi:hypothetical protein